MASHCRCKGGAGNATVSANLSGSSSVGLTLLVHGGWRGGGAWLRLRRRHRAFANPRAVLQRQPAATPTQSDEEALEVFPQPG